MVDPCTSPLPPEGLVEVKNPYSYRDSLLQEAIDSKNCHYLTSVEGHFSLKSSHKYYHQVQFAMLVLVKLGATSLFLPKTVLGRELNMTKSFACHWFPRPLFQN